MDDRKFRVDSVGFDKDKVSLQDMALADARMPIFREEPLTVVRELYEQQDEALDTAPEKTPDYNVGDSVVVDLPTRTIEGTIGYVGETDVRIDTSAQGYSWSNEVLNKQQFEDGLRQDEPELSDEELDKLPTSVEVNGEWQTFPDAAAADKALNSRTCAGSCRNIPHHGRSSGRGRRKNKNMPGTLKAIRTLFQLEQEHRGATAEEQQILSQYVGWGGLPDVFDPDKGNWAKEYSELKGLLSEDEYAAARSSVLNAHYTSLPLSAPSMMQSRKWGSATATFWSRAWASATFLVCCRTPCRTAAYTVWSWTVSQAVSPKSSTRMPTLKLPDLKPLTAATSMTLQWAMFLLASTG